MPLQDLSNRLLCSLMSCVVIALVLVLAGYPLMMWILPIGVAVIGAVGVWEYAKLTGLNKTKGYLSILISFGALVILSFFLSAVCPRFSLLPLGAVLMSVLVIFLYHFDKIQGAASSISQGFFGICYVAVPLGLLMKILYFSHFFGGVSQGRFWVLYLLVVTKITDVGAYFGGSVLGQRRLALQLSPAKTIAGAIVGFTCALIFSILFYLLSPYIKGVHLTFLQSLWLGALLGCFAQVGDLAESLLKRGAAVKNSNRLPGFGGVLDMFDSLLFTIPIIYLFLSA